MGGLGCVSQDDPHWLKSLKSIMKETAKVVVKGVVSDTVNSVVDAVFTRPDPAANELAEMENQLDYMKIQRLKEGRT